MPLTPNQWQIQYTHDSCDIYYCLLFIVNRRIVNNVTPIRCGFGGVRLRRFFQVRCDYQRSTSKLFSMITCTHTQHACRGEKTCEMNGICYNNNNIPLPLLVLILEELLPESTKNPRELSERIIWYIYIYFSCTVLLHEPITFM